MNNRYTFQLANIGELTFTSTDIPDFSNISTNNSAFRLTSADLDGMPEDTVDLNALRRKLSEILHDRFHDNITLIETDCDIKRDTFQRVLRGKRNPTYDFLSKLCVGAKLSMDEAYELFLLIGYELSCNIKPDYILMCELNNGCDICEYDADMRKYCNKSIF